jgi:predicted hydrolase (HD superfamily)
MLQSARLAAKSGAPEKVVVACLLHDIAITGFIRSDHGYWAAQLVEPYVDEEVAWAIRYHQALRFYPDESVGYQYPELYKTLFGEDYQPDPHIARPIKRRASTSGT